MSWNIVLEMKEIKEIQKLRKKHNLTQKELASRAGVSQSLIAKVEAHKIEPTYAKAKRIFEALEELRTKDELKAKDVMIKQVSFAKVNEPIKTVIKIMKKKSISQMPVLDKEKVCGLISEKTILKKIIENPHNISLLKVKEVMDEDPPIVSPKTGLRTLLELLRDHPLVLVAERGNIRGIISKTDLLNKVE